MILSVCGTKGGSGKSTIAQNLAVYLAHANRDVLIIDTDGQQATSYKWAHRRAENWPEAAVIHREQASGDIYDVIKARAGRYDDIIIDSGGYDSDAMRTGLMAADTALAVFRPAQADIENFARVESIINDVSKLNRGLTAKLVLTQCPTNQRTETSDVREAIESAQSDVFSLCQQLIRERRAFRDATREGVGVIEMNDSKAKAEVQLLAQEVFNG